MNGVKGNNTGFDAPDTEPRRKPGKRVSDSKKRADHKHVYEDSISVYLSYIDGSVLHASSSKHCSICGRYGGQASGGLIGDWRKYSVFAQDGTARPMTVEEIKEQFPGIPIYSSGTDMNHILPDIRIV